MERFDSTASGASLPIEPITSSPLAAMGSRMNLKSSWVQPNACWRSSSGTAVWVAGEAVLGAGSDSSLTCRRSIHWRYGRLLASCSLISPSSMMRPCSRSIRNILPGCRRHFLTMRFSGIDSVPASDAMMTMSSSVIR
ncbi:Uncharacterised protein [Bordetella pertussis]|nr:Uncharacterised protein [Bordetella pertussis]